MKGDNWELMRVEVDFDAGADVVTELVPVEGSGLVELAIEAEGPLTDVVLLAEACRRRCVGRRERRDNGCHLERFPSGWLLRYEILNLEKEQHIYSTVFKTQLNRQAEISTEEAS
jgi:hypothetical protein